MFNQQTLTIYNIFVGTDKKVSYFKRVLYGNHVDEKRRTSFQRAGQKQLHSAYISIKDIDKYVDELEWVKLDADEKEQYYTVQNNGFDFVILGVCDFELNTNDVNSLQDSILQLKKSFKTYKTGEYDTKFHGSRRLWHIEVGGI